MLLDMSAYLCVWVDRPCSPGQPSVTSITRRSAVLSWYGCCYDGGSTVTGYRIELQLLQQQQQQQLLQDDTTRSNDDQQWHTVTDHCQVHRLLVLLSSFD